MTTIDEFKASLIKAIESHRHEYHYKTRLDIFDFGVDEAFDLAVQAVKQTSARLPWRDWETEPPPTDGSVMDILLKGKQTYFLTARLKNGEFHIIRFDGREFLPLKKDIHPALNGLKWRPIDMPEWEA